MVQVLTYKLFVTHHVLLSFSQLTMNVKAKASVFAPCMGHTRHEHWVQVTGQKVGLHALHNVHVISIVN